MSKTFILDTNVLLYDPTAFHRFSEGRVIVPVEVIEELDGFKRDVSELGQNSRAISSQLDQLAKNGRLGRGARLPSGGLLQIYTDRFDDVIRKKGLGLKKTVENRLLNLALHIIKEGGPEDLTILISKNINLRIKADALGIKTQDYEANHQLLESNVYTGIKEIFVDREVIESIHNKGVCYQEKNTFFPNEYVLLKDRIDEKNSVMTKASGKDGNKLIPILNTNNGLFGIRPLNVRQCFAFDALLNDDVKLVTLLGKAGTGKTLLAVAAGLLKVIQENKYRKILISRPIMPLGRDIGYIPGDVEDKMRPWMQPIYDALEMVREQDRYSKKKILPPDLLDSDEIGIEPLTYIRGRSIPNQFFMIDEAQNLTPHEVKTIITRIGFNSKVVLTGDTEQIDNPYVDSFSNGFSYLVHRFRQQEIAAHITLTKGERSELAEIATKLL